MDALNVSAAHTQRNIEGSPQSEQRDKDWVRQVEVRLERSIEKKQQKTEPYSSDPRSQMQGRENPFLFCLGFTAGNVFCADNLERERNRRCQHQQRIYGSGVRESRGSQQARSDNVVNEIRNAD